MGVGVAASAVAVVGVVLLLLTVVDGGVVAAVVVDGAVFVAFSFPPTNTDYFGGVASHHALALGDGVSRQDREDLGSRRGLGDAEGQDGGPEAQACGDGADAQAYPYTRVACSGEGPFVQYYHRCDGPGRDGFKEGTHDVETQRVYIVSSLHRVAVDEHRRIVECSTEKYAYCLLSIWKRQIPFHKISRRRAREHSQHSSCSANGITKHRSHEV